MRDGLDARTDDDCSCALQAENGQAVANKPFFLDMQRFARRRRVRPRTETTTKVSTSEDLHEWRPQALLNAASRTGQRRTKSRVQMLLVRSYYANGER